MASSEDHWVATVCWHTEYLGWSDSHRINVKRFWDDKEASEYYDNVSTAYAKKFYSKESSEKVYSEEWAKWIPNPITGYSANNCWVSYLTSYDENQDYYVVVVKYFSDENSADEYYEKTKDEVKKLTVKGEVKKKEGYETPYLI